MTGEDKVYVKVPTFDGRKNQWLYFKPKFMSYLAQKDMVEILSFEDPIPRDDETWTADERKTAEVKLKMKVGTSSSRLAPR